jgi:acetylornithine deacetylase
VASSVERRLDEAVDRLRSEYVDLLASLVRQPSLLGQERPAQEIVHRHLRRRLGLAAEMWDLDLGALGPHPAFVPTSWSYEGRPNVTARWAGSGGGRSLVVNGHIDVVSPEPVDWWTHDPWGGIVVGDRLYGRGAYDMKSGLVAGLLALHAVREAGPPLRGSVIVESVIEEECTGNGMLAARLRSGRVDGALITEPSDLAARVATPGVIWFETTVVGLPAYVGLGAQYVNAVDKATDLIVALRSLPDELNRDVRHPLYAGVERPFTLSVGTIRAGDWPSSVPLECRFTCRMSFPLEWSVERAQQLVERCLREASSGDAWLAEHPPLVRYPGFRAKGWEIAADAPLVELLAQCHRGVAGRDITIAPTFGTADARYFDVAAGEQAAYFGPAGGGHHTPDEYADLESMAVAAKVIARFIVEWCS